MTGTSFQTAIEIYVSDSTNDTISSYISPSESERFFVFNAEIGKSYLFRTSGSYDLMAYLYDESFNQITMDDDSAGNLNPLLSFYAVNEKYYIKVRGYNDPAQNVTFDVNLIEGELIIIDPDEPEGVIVRCTAINIYGYGRSSDISG